MELGEMKTEVDFIKTDGKTSVELKKPKRVLHFSDGTLEEFDDCDEEKIVKEKRADLQAVVEAELQWGPWFLHKAVKAGSTVVAGCDYVGESLASFLGITTPKYQSEIAEYKKAQAENAEIERKRAEDSSWIINENSNGDVIASDLTASKQEKF